MKADLASAFLSLWLWGCCAAFLASCTRPEDGPATLVVFVLVGLALGARSFLRERR